MVIGSRLTPPCTNYLGLFGQATPSERCLRKDEMSYYALAFMHLVNQAVRRNFLVFAGFGAVFEGAGVLARLFLRADIRSITGAKRLVCSCLGAARPCDLLATSSFTRS